MKKMILAALALGAGAWQGTADAQLYVVKDGEVKAAFDYTPDYVTFENPMACGGIVGTAVDLGLSVKWSSVNVGASSPEEYGNYYAWGETEPKTDYTWATYKFMQSGKSSWCFINKYQAPDNQYRAAWYDADGNFIGDDKTTLEPEDDAAAANWGGDWATPTLEDYNELMGNTYRVWTTNYNGTQKSGCIVYEPKRDEHKGYYERNTPSNLYSLSDPHIFLPAAGRKGGSTYSGNGTGYYWLALIYTYKSTSAYSYYFSFSSSNTFSWNSEQRLRGYNVRPVCPSSGNANGHATVNFNLPSGKLWATCNVGAEAPQDAGYYLAWGETAQKETYSWATYALLREGGTTWKDINKYTFADGQSEGGIWYTDALEFTGDGKTILEPADDAAAVNWRGKWRMPTKEEWKELNDNCYWVRTNGYNGLEVAGYIVYKPKSDEDKGVHVGLSGTPKPSYSVSDLHIFLPIPGVYEGDELSGVGSSQVYWSSSLYTIDSKGAHRAESNDILRYYGGSIRPVCPAGE